MCIHSQTFVGLVRNAAWDDKPSEHKRLQLERQLEKSRDNTGLKLGGDPTVCFLLIIGRFGQCNQF
jgi:hypothetical protein